MSSMPCPFARKLPTTFLKNYAGSLVKTYGDQCPAIRRAVATFHQPGFNAEAAANVAQKCPFLANSVQEPESVIKMASPSISEDIIQQKSKISTFPNITCFLSHTSIFQALLSMKDSSKAKF